jgi:hypothetical protein
MMKLKHKKLTADFEKNCLATFRVFEQHYTSQKACIFTQTIQRVLGERPRAFLGGNGYLVKGLDQINLGKDSAVCYVGGDF